MVNLTGGVDGTGDEESFLMFGSLWHNFIIRKYNILSLSEHVHYFRKGAYDVQMDI